MLVESRPGQQQKLRRTLSNGPTKSWVNDGSAAGAAGPDGRYATSDFTNAENQYAGTGFTIFPLNGAITKVEAVFSLYNDLSALVDDQVFGAVYFNNDATPLASTTLANTSLNALGLGSSKQGLYAWDVTGLRTWNWADFSGNLDLMISTKPSGTKDGTKIYLDAIGFRITAATSCSEDFIETVPLTDTYDTRLLTFVSAEPPVSDHNPSAGLLTWNNIGAINPGQTKTVQVTFLAKEPNPQVDTNHTNYAGVTGARFPDNINANNDYDSVTGLIRPTAIISGVVFKDVVPTGWLSGSSTGYGVEDSFLPNVTVSLYRCAGLPAAPDLTQGCTGNKNNGTWTELKSSVTDANGKFVFTSLLNGYYYAQVNTGTIVGYASSTTDADAANSVNRCIDPSCTATDSRWQHPNGLLGNMRYLNYAGNPGNFTDINFGYTLNTSLFGIVWQDADGDGNLETGDNGIAGVSVSLVNCGADNDCTTTADNSTTSLTTDANGKYNAAGLVTGRRYEIIVNTTTLPSGGIWNQVDDPDDLDSRYDFIPTPGTQNGSFDFGYYRSGAYSIGDTVFTDWNGNAVQETGEEGLSAVTVWLYEDSNQNGVIDPMTDGLILTTTTDTNGLYHFNGLYSGNYIVRIDDTLLPDWENYKQTKDPDQSSVCFFCNNTGSAAVSAALPLNNNIDFGYQPLGSAKVGDRVWRELRRRWDPGPRRDRGR